MNEGGAQKSPEALLERLKEQDRARLRVYIGAAPGVSYRDLMRACNLSKADMTRVLETLNAEERIRRDGRNFWLREDEASAVSAAVSGTTTDTKQPITMRVN